MSDMMRAPSTHIFKSGKKYPHSIGLSCAFRQWRAESHCHFLHGYALQIEFTFSARFLDRRNWVVDFGSLKPLKALLENNLDHKTLVAEDDPHLPLFRQMASAGIIDLNIVPHCGVEALAYMIYEITEQWLKDAGYGNVQLDEVVVREHDANWASYGRATSNAE